MQTSRHTYTNSEFDSDQKYTYTFIGCRKRFDKLHTPRNFGGDFNDNNNCISNGIMAFGVNLKKLESERKKILLRHQCEHFAMLLTCAFVKVPVQRLYLTHGNSKK